MQIKLMKMKMESSMEENIKELKMILEIYENLQIYWESTLFIKADTHFQYISRSPVFEENETHEKV